MADSKLMQLTGIHYATGEAIILTVGDGRIIDMKQLTSQQDDLPMIGPGLVDLQINGYDGDDFSSFPMESDRVVRITRKL